MSAKTPNDISGREKRLPVELYPIILGFLPRSDLPPAMTVSSAFYLPGCRYLYTSLDVDLSTACHPFVPLSPSSRTSADDPSLNPVQRPLLASLPSRFTYTTHLTLTTHSLNECDHLPPPHMPNLVSLHIRPQDNLRVHTICHCRSTGGMDPCAKDKACACPLISALRPPQLILGNIQSGLAGSAFPWPSPSSSVPDFVEHLVVTVFAVSHLMGCRSFFAAIPPTVKRLTIVVQRWEDMEGSQDGWITDSEDEDRPADMPQGPRWMSDGDIVVMMWRAALGPAMEGRAKAMEVVGYDTIAGWSERVGEVEKQCKALGNVLRLSLIRAGVEAAPAAKRASDIRFMSGEEYVSGDGGEAVKELVREVVIQGRFRASA